MKTQASDVERRLRRIEKTIPYLFRLCAILAAFPSARSVISAHRFCISRDWPDFRA